MKPITLYTNPQSRGRIIRWMLEELNVPYNVEVLQYGPEMKSAEFLALNPMGKVPVITHGDLVITEAAAICAYLADHFADKQLAPALDSPQRGSYYRWLFFAAGPVEQAIVTIIFPLFSGRWATRMAAQTLAPVEMPAKIPSSSSSSRVRRTASRGPTE